MLFSIRTKKRKKGGISEKKDTGWKYIKIRIMLISRKQYHG